MNYHEARRLYRIAIPLGGKLERTEAAITKRLDAWNALMDLIGLDWEMYRRRKLDKLQRMIHDERNRVSAVR